MNENPIWSEWSERENNFYTQNTISSNYSKSHFYMELQGLSESIEADIKKSGLNKRQMLKMIFSRVYNFLIFNNDNYSIFSEKKDVYESVFDACFFISLCMFLYDSKRSGGMSIRKFLYINSPLKYNISNTPNHFDFKYTTKNSPKCKSINSEETSLRKYRHRLLKERPVYIDSTEGSAIRKVSEHQWTLYFDLKDADKDIQNTFKQIRLLYTEIYEALHSPMDKGYKERIDKAFHKFLYRLEKIKYEKYLELCKFILGHINKNKNYYGFNLYLFEKELRLNNITNEVNQLLKCKNEDEEAYILDKQEILDGIIFPNICKAFGRLSDFRTIGYYTKTFLQFLNDLVCTSRLVIDNFIESGFFELSDNDSHEFKIKEPFEENWINLFLKTINEMAKTVLYAPDEVNYSIMPESQDKFIYSISIPVMKLIYRNVGLSNYMSFDSSESDDEI